MDQSSCDECVVHRLQITSERAPLQNNVERSFLVVVHVLFWPDKTFQTESCGVGTPNLRLLCFYTVQLLQKWLNSMSLEDQIAPTVAESVSTNHTECLLGWRFQGPTGETIRSKNHMLKYLLTNKIQDFSIEEFYPPRKQIEQNLDPEYGCTVKQKQLTAEGLKRLTKNGKHKRQIRDPVRQKGARVDSFRCGTVRMHKKKRWIPPRSPYQLIQENYYDNPWQLLVATIFLQRTQGQLATRLALKFFEKWPSPKEVIATEQQEISTFLKGIGLHEIRAKIIKRFSEEFISKPWTYPRELHGIGKYGDDSYRIFCLGDWKAVRPTDHLLNDYVDWLSDTWHGHVMRMEKERTPKRMMEMKYVGKRKQGRQRKICKEQITETVQFALPRQTNMASLPPEAHNDTSRIY
uniref:HhH-GPD domain-containing protein n=1 Tax=Timema monikensis TaxID=170555 RepID=A0A7R9DYU8_9NEOP|nr:unnamed protein product [Timema monikensis]